MRDENDAPLGFKIAAVAILCGAFLFSASTRVDYARFTRDWRPAPAFLFERLAKANDSCPNARVLVAKDTLTKPAPERDYLLACTVGWSPDWSVRLVNAGSIGSEVQLPAAIPQPRL